MKRERLVEILAEIMRREKNNHLKRYNSGEIIHCKQLEFHKCTKRNRWVFGGNRSGKTECGAVEVVWFARGIHPFKSNKSSCSIWVVSLSQQVQRDVAQNKILHYLNPQWIQEVVMLTGKKGFPESGVIDYILVKTVQGEISKIGFKTCDQGREKFQGTSLDYVWFDEEPPYDIYTECRMRVLDKCGEIFGTMTPLKGLTWVYDVIYLNKFDDPEVWHEHMSWEDNPFLNSSEIESLKNSMSEEELESRKEGKFIANGGLVYSEFDSQIHVIEPFDVPKEWYSSISIDPGLNNPLSAHWYAVDYDSNIFVIAEHFEKGKPVAYHASQIKAICNRLGWHCSSNGMIECLIDSAADQHTLASEKSVTELFYDNGILASTRVNKDLFSGIQRVKSYLKNANGKARLFIFKTCVNLIREIKSYWWGNGDNPIKKDDHALDELRYFVMSRPDTPFVKETKSEIQKHKERLFRELKNNKKNLL
ncbi:MAG: terminase family protein [Clostridia bacterium]